MAAIVCHGLQSCLESQLVESRIHRLRLPSPKPKPLLTQPIDVAFKSCLLEPNTKPHCDENGYKAETVSGWSFIQSLPIASSQLDLKETTASANTYVHPQVKQSSLRLSPKSLELCTENLGNETGTDITESGIDFDFDFLSNNNSGRRGQGKTPRQLLEERKKKNGPRNFPPPLTTMRGPESLTVRPHREGGRLVIEATKAPSTTSCFHAERSHGRLRLRLVENHPNPSSLDPEEEEEEEDEEENVEDEVEFESEVNEQTQNVEEEEEEETEEEAETETEVYGMIMEKYERGKMRRCKEGDRENNELLLINWGKSLWVATS